MPQIVALDGVELRENEPLSRHTRFELGGPARFLIDVASAAALPSALTLARQSGLPLTILGGGSNLVVADQGLDGIVVRFRGSRIEHRGSRTYAESGATWQAVVDFHIEHNLGGMEKMTRIPGWLGGALYGNAGAYGQSIMDFVESVDIWNGQDFRQIPHAECGFEYRTSGFKRHKDWILLGATLRLAPGDPAALRAAELEIRTVRDEKFPPTLRCAGSIFKNLQAAALPTAALSRVPSALIRGGKIPSAWFLEQVGAKGMRRGGIAVADYHANLLYNTGTGTAAEVCALIDELKRLVEKEFGFSLEEEVQYVGFPDRESY